MTKYSRMRFVPLVLALACAVSFTAVGTAQAEETQGKKNWFERFWSWAGGTTANTGAAAGNFASNTGGAAASAVVNTGETLSGQGDQLGQIIAEPTARMVNATGQIVSETAGAAPKAAEAASQE